MFKCEQCDEKFSRKFNKNRHVQRLHKNSQNLKKLNSEHKIKQSGCNQHDDLATKIKNDHILHNILAFKEKNGSSNNSLNNLRSVKTIDPYTQFSKHYKYSVCNQSENNKNFNRNCDVEMYTSELDNIINGLNNKNDFKGMIIFDRCQWIGWYTKNRNSPDNYITMIMQKW